METDCSKMKFRRWPLFFLCLLVADCATSIAPQGGPEDKYPPRVAGVFPAPGAVNVAPELNVHLQFDEWIASSVPRSAVTISPPLEKRLRFEVDGDELFIRSKARLDENTTYTLTIASGLKDLRGNAIAEPFRLTFSTGPVIDSLSVSGRVMVTPAMGKKKLYPTVGLFLMGAAERSAHHYLEKFRDSLSVDADSMPRLTREIPLFSTQTDSLGRFHLAGLKAGRYRVVAFLDENGNQKVEPSVELAGVGEFDLELSPQGADTLWIALADQDTTPVSLDAVTQTGKSSLSARFSRNLYLDSALLSKENCALFSPDSERISPDWIYRSPKGGDVEFYFDSLANRDSSYTFACKAGRDSLGRRLSERLSTLSIDWKEMKGDTLPPARVSTFPANGAKNVFPKDSVEVVYGKPVADSLLDSLRERLIFVQNKDTLPARISRKDPVRFLVFGDERFQTDAKVELLERYADSTLSSPDSVTGKRDTVVTQKTRVWVKFETVPKLQLSSLSGKIPGASTETRVRVRKVDSEVLVTANCTIDGNFRMDDLVEGKYLMEYFQTKDSLDTPYAGNLFEFDYGMPWRALADTLVIERGANTLQAIESRLPILSAGKK